MTLKILPINPPYLTLTSLLAIGHQIPPGLLWLGELIWELLGIRCAWHATKAMAAQAEPKKNRKDLEQIKESNGKPATRRPKVKRLRPLKNVQFWSRLRKARISTTGIY